MFSTLKEPLVFHQVFLVPWSKAMLKAPLVISLGVAAVWENLSVNLPESATPPPTAVESVMELFSLLSLNIFTSSSDPHLSVLSNKDVFVSCQVVVTDG